MSDGTRAGTMLLADIAEGDRNSLPYQPVVARGHLFFTAHDAGKRPELWSTDGDSTGTRLVKEFPSDTPCGMAPVAAIGGIVFLEGCTLWESDGTDRGTVKVGGGASASREYGVLSDILLFQNQTDAGRASLSGPRRRSRTSGGDGPATTDAFSGRAGSNAAPSR